MGNINYIKPNFPFQVNKLNKKIGNNWHRLLKNCPLQIQFFRLEHIKEELVEEKTQMHMPPGKIKY